jgi:hypothetical protein
VVDYRRGGSTRSGVVRLEGTQTMSFLSSFFLPKSEIDRGAELDAKLRALNQTKVDNGSWTTGQRDAADANLIEQGATTYEQQINTAFDQGLAEGWANVTGGIKATLAAPFKFTFASIPWQLWLVGALVLLYYAGGAQRLKNILLK